MPIYGSFDVLIPKKQYIQKWPVIACDQFTSQPEYWNAMRATIGDQPSTLHCIMPEAEFGSADENKYSEIHRNMRSYLEQDIFTEYKDSFVYVERNLQNGAIRRGVVGVIDFEAYDYSSNSTSPIRTTEKTVVERIPPRMKVRSGASLDLSHVILLCDDERREIIEPLQGADGKVIYDLHLLQNGGHIKGKLIDCYEAEKLRQRIEEYCVRKSEELNGFIFAVGDGNHSLATAKVCYEELKKTSTDAVAINRARYAMVELENIHDEAQEFEPIHRIIYDSDYKGLIRYLQQNWCAEKGYPVEWITREKGGVLYLDREKGVLPIAILQNALDHYLMSHSGRIDYIQGDETLWKLASKKNSIGFLLPSIPKDDFFRGISNDGVLPRKTFSMGEAEEKRYYLEARRL